MRRNRATRRSSPSAELTASMPCCRVGFASGPLDRAEGGAVSGGSGGAAGLAGAVAGRSRLQDSEYTSRTALLTKRSAVRSTNTWLPSVHDGAVKGGLGVRREFPA